MAEWRKRGKSNVFVDRRIGENDPHLSIEDKMLQRFAAERKVSSSRLFCSVSWHALHVHVI